MRLERARRGLPHQHGRLSGGEIAYGSLRGVFGIARCHDFVLGEEIDELFHGRDRTGRIEAGPSGAVEEIRAVLFAEYEGVVGVLGVAGALDRQPPPAAAGQLSAVGHQFVPGGGRCGDAGLFEELLVVVEAVGEGVERHGRRVLARRAGGGERRGHESVSAADGPERRVVEGQQRAAGLE